MKKIGIPMVLSAIGNCGIGASYFEYFSEMFEGAEVVLLPPKHTIVDLDLLVLPGGADVAPSRYGGIPTVGTSYSNVYLEHFDMHYLPKYIRNGVPIFGICRGHQTLNVTFGGILQEIYHNTNPNGEPGKKMHHVFLSSILEHTFPEGGMSDLVRATAGFPKSFEVNSRHHQGFGIDNLAEDFIPIYVDKKKGATCVEAMMHRDLPIISVQWHPEDLLDEFSLDIIEFLLEHSKTELNEISSKSTFKKS